MDRIMTKARRDALSRLALACLLLSTQLRPAAAQQDRFGGQTDVVAVEVPVNVTRDGRPLRGLTIKDFEVFEGRKRHEIVAFDVIDLAEITAGSGPGQSSELSLAARRHFLFLFDLSFSAPGSVVKARDAARELVQGGLHDSDLVAVATYAETRGAELALGFTSDREQVDAAIESLGLVDRIQSVADPLKFVIEPSLERSVKLGRGATQGPGDALNVDDVFLETIQDISTFTTRVDRDRQISQILNLSGSMGELAGYLRSASGRKHVVLFSEGFDSSVVLGTEDQSRVAQITADAQSGRFWRVDSDERFGNSTAQAGLFDMLEAFRRCDCAIQAVDIGGVRAGFDSGEAAEVRQDRARGQDGLFIMANQTGGEFYRNYNDLTEAMGKLLDRTSVTYVLTLAPASLATDGSYHPLEVRLKKSHKRARVVHRPGFYAPRPYTDLSPEERRFATAEMILRGREGGDLNLSILAAAFEGRAGWSHVATYVEIDGFTLMAGHTAPQLPAEIFAYAIDSQGATSDFFSQGVLLDLNEVGSALDARGFKFLGHFDLAPGSYEIRAVVRNAATGAAGLTKTRIEVPAFAERQTSLLPPLFIEPEGLWLLGRERPDRRGEVDYPLETAGRHLIPSARPILKREVPVPVLLLTHYLDGGELTAEARLVSRDGSIRQPVAIVLEPRGKKTRVERLAATVVPSGVEPGNYLLEVELASLSRGAAISSSIPVTIY